MATESGGKYDKLSIHGVLLEIFGTGTLLVGESGTGKSETALELLRREHILVADDAVDIWKEHEQLFGSAPPLTFEYLEVRRLGIVNAREMFGPDSVKQTVRIELCVELVAQDSEPEADSIGLDESAFDLLDISLPKLTFAAGRNLPTLIETAVRVISLQGSGASAARRLVERHTLLTGGCL